jgi:dihydrodiol dehydrogenase / D-xylose 1-dehydrogenase (NADP)
LKAVRWGILGTGTMAEQFAGALSTLPDSILGGVVSRTRGRGNEFAARFGVKRSFESVPELLADPTIDIVYVATRNEFHTEDMLATLNAGKAVLCEKPFALNASEGRAVVETARRLRIFCMEAMWMRFSPAVIELRNIVKRGQIGFPQLIAAQFGVSIPFDRDHRVYAPQGGGALYDLGVYPISLTQMLLGKPKSICSRSHTGEMGVDEQFTALLQYESGSQAMIGASLRANLSNDAQVFGTAGRCNLTGGIYFPTGCHIEMNDSTRNSGERRGIGQKVGSRLARWGPQRRETRWRKHSIREGYACEARAVHRSLLSGSTECSEMPLEDTLEVLEIMDEIRNQWA